MPIQVPYRHYSGLVGTGLGEFGGRQPVWHRSAPALVAAIDKRKKGAARESQVPLPCVQCSSCPVQARNNRSFKLPSFTAVFCSVNNIASRPFHARDDGGL